MEAPLEGEQYEKYECDDERFVHGIYLSVVHLVAALAASAPL